MKKSTLIAAVVSALAAGAILLPETRASAAQWYLSEYIHPNHVTYETYDYFGPGNGARVRFYSSDAVETDDLVADRWVSVSAYCSGQWSDWWTMLGYVRHHCDGGASPTWGRGAVWDN